jgi:hypothetical protein
VVARSRGGRRIRGLRRVARTRGVASCTVAVGGAWPLRQRWLRCSREVVGPCVGLCMASNGDAATAGRVSILSGVVCSMACGTGGDGARRMASTDKELRVCCEEEGCDVRACVCVFVGSTVCEFVLVFESVMSRQEFELVVASCASVCSVWMVCVWLRVRVRGKCAPCVASLCNAV